MQQQLQQQLQQRLQQQRQQQRQHSHTRGCLPAHAHPHAHPLTRPHSHGHTHGHGHSHSGAGRIQGSELRPGTPRIATRGSVPDAIMSAREPLRNAYNSQGVPYALIPGALPATGSAVRSCSCDAGVLPPAVVDLIGQVLSPKSLERRVTPNPRDTPYLSKAAVAAADAAAAAAATNSQHATPRSRREQTRHEPSKPYEFGRESWGSACDNVLQCVFRCKCPHVHRETGLPKQNGSGSPYASSKVWIEAGPPEMWPSARAAACVA
eukprot:346788-Chlamydomonas_euryale.AAC.5